MQLLLLVWRQYRWPFIAVMALSLASAALGIGLIAFINVRLIEMVDTSLSVLPEFLGLLLLLMAVTLGSQLALTALGHHFVFRLRSEFIKRILDTQVERVEPVPVGGGHFPKGRPEVDGGRVDEDVDPAEALDGGRGEDRDLRGIGEIGGDRRHLDPAAADLGGGRAGFLVGTMMMESDRGALAGELERDHPPQPPRPARHERDLPAELHR